MRKTALLAILAGCVAAGCAHYRFGNPVPESRRKLAVPVFASSVTQPEAEAVVTQALCREVIRDGSFTLTNAGDAALTLKGTVTAYTLKPLRYLENTSGTPVEYRAMLTAEVTVIETATGAVVAPPFTLTAETTALARDDLATAKGSALHRAAQGLARAILLEAVTRCGE
jgi:hypothetical protein